MAKLDNNDLGIIKSQSSDKDSGLFFSPIPGTDSDEAIVIDIMGNQRTIEIIGEYIGTSTTIQTFVTAMDDLQNGNQNPVEFDGHFIKVNVVVQRFRWDYVEADPNRIKYNLTLVEGALG